MPQTLTETALLTIAVAVSVQALAITALCIAAWFASQRLHATLRAESANLQLRIDEALRHVRTTADSMSRMSEEAGVVAARASRMIDDASDTWRNVASAVVAPRALLAAGAAAGVRALLRHWPLARGSR